jgi:gliding motility-associated-like protein
MKRIIGAVLILIGLLQSVHAAHMRGGEIFWHCISADNRVEINNTYNSNFTVADEGKFVFIAKLYGDCSGTVSILNNFTPQFEISGYAGGGPTTSPTIFVAATDISPDCYDNDLKWTCGQAPFQSYGATGPLNGIGATAEYVFRSNAFQLNGSPPQNGAWTISIGPHCCRNAAVNIINASSTSFFLKSEMYPYPDVPNPRAHGALPPFKSMYPCYDNSPEFLELPNVISCNGYEFTYGPLAFDIELDSLVYDWAPPLSAANNPLPNAPGYSATSPLPSTAPSVGAVLDPVTGLITFESHVDGAFTTNTEVMAYRCGIPIAAIYRDVQIVTADCDAAYTSQNPPITPPSNDPPSVTFIPDPNLTMTNPSNNVYRFTVEAGTLVEFTLNAQDFDLHPNSQFQTITFEAASGQLGQPWSSTTNCLNPPCATIVPAQGQTGFQASLNNTVEFSWQTECAHLATEVGCGVFSNEYVFYLKMEDDYCPTPARTLVTVIVDVQAGTAEPPELMCVSRLPGGEVELTWLPDPDTGFAFNYYVIERDANGTGNFLPVDTVYDFDPGTHVFNDTAVHPNYYRIRVNAGCNFLSTASNVVGSIQLDLTALPLTSTDKDTADLVWNNPRPNDTIPINYEVQMELPAGSGTWTTIANLQDITEWIEAVQVCEMDVDFRVLVETFNNDSSFSCISYSNIDGALFSDVTNDDTININYVTVDADGNAELSFDPSASGDVVAYYILYFNPATNSWDIIDTVGAIGVYTWMDSEADSRIERFKVISVDSCGNVSSDTPVIPHNTLLLESTVNLCAGTNELTWNSYNGWGNDFMGYEIRADIDQGGGVTPDVLLYSGGADDTSYVQDEFIAGAIYCYRVVALHSDSVTISESAPICMDPGVPNPSEMLYISYTEARGDGILFRGFADGESDATHIIIERSTEREGTYFELAQIAVPENPPYTFTYIDYLAKPADEVYYYRMIAMDSCDGIDTISNIVNNIRVEIETKRNEQNWVSWNSYVGFMGDIEQYELYRSEGEGEQFELIAGNLTPNDTVYIDNLSMLDKNISRYCYYVRAIEANNPLDLPDEFQPFISVSNQACATQKAKLLVPNAFKPGSDIEENRTFGVKDRFVDINNFEFVVINRWGRVVFETNDPDAEWDGTIGGKIAPTGVYSYIIRYQTKGEIPEEIVGTFTLIQ